MEEEVPIADYKNLLLCPLPFDILHNL